MLSSVLPDRMRVLAWMPRLFFALFALAATVGVISGGAWAGIAIGGALLLLFGHWYGAGLFPRPSQTASLFVLGLLATMALSCFSAIDLHLALSNSFRMATVLIPLLFFSSPALQAQGEGRSFDAVVLALLLAMGFFLLDGLLVGHMLSAVENKEFLLSKLNRGFSHGALLFWPVVAALMGPSLEGRRQRGMAVFLLASLALTFLLTNSRATQVGLAMALGVFLLARLSFRLAFGVVGLGSFLALFWPLGAASLFAERPDLVAKLPGSWHMRVEIWDYTAHRIAERPWNGYGIGNSGLLDVTVPHGALYSLVRGPAPHSHNAICQVWSELGVLGPLFVLFLGLWTLSRLYCLVPRLRAYGLAAYTLAFWLAMVAYNFWTDSLWAAFTLTALAFVLVQQREIKASLRGMAA